MTPNTTHKKNKADIEDFDKTDLAPLLVKHPDNAFLKSVRTLHRKVIKRCAESIKATKKDGYTAGYERLWAILKYGSKPKGQEEAHEHIDDYEQVIGCAKLYMKDIKKRDVSQRMIERWIQDEMWEQYEANVVVKDKPKCQICNDLPRTTTMSLRKAGTAVGTTYMVCDVCKKYDRMNVEDVKAERNKA